MMDGARVIAAGGGEGFDFGGLGVQWKIDGSDAGRRFAAINEQYALDMDFGSVAGLCDRFGLSFPSL